MRSKSASSSGTPASRAIARRCSTPFVEPPIATRVTIAFSKASRVRMSDGRMPSRSRRITASPAARQTSTRRGSSAGIDALPGSDIPSASTQDAIVFAVYMPPHDPAPGQATHSSRYSSSAVIWPRAYFPTASNTSTIVTSRPSNRPGMIVPPYRNTAGTLSRAIASIMPGRPLSHPAIATRPSNASARTISSTESAMTSRLTSDAFIPSCPIAIASLTAIVVNSIGVPPAARTPSFTWRASTFRWRLQGVTSFHEEATPMSGFRRSSSVSPVARSIARWGARAGPSVTAAERRVRSAVVLAMQRCLLPRYERPISIARGRRNAHASTGGFSGAPEGPFRRGGLAYRSRPAPSDAPGVKIPAVDDRQPEPAGRHRVALRRAVHVERDLDAGDAGVRPQGGSRVGIDRVARPVPREEDDAVARPPPVGVPPSAARVQLDDRIEPPGAVQVGPLLGHPQVALDDRPTDRLDVDDPREPAQVRADPPREVRLERRTARREHGPVVEHPAGARVSHGVTPPAWHPLGEDDVGADVLSPQELHPHVAGPEVRLQLTRGPDDPPSRPHPVEIDDGLAEDREALRRDPVRAVADPLALADEELVVDLPVLRVEGPGDRVADRDDDRRRARDVLEVLPPPDIDAAKARAALSGPVALQVVEPQESRPVGRPPSAVTPHPPPHPSTGRTGVAGADAASSMPSGPTFGAGKASPPVRFRQRRLSGRDAPVSTALTPPQSLGALRALPTRRLRGVDSSFRRQVGGLSSAHPRRAGRAPRSPGTVRRTPQKGGAG